MGEALGIWNSGSGWGESGRSQCAGLGPDGPLKKMITSSSWPGATGQLTALPFLIIQGQSMNEGFLSLRQHWGWVGFVLLEKKGQVIFPKVIEAKITSLSTIDPFCAEDGPWKFQNLCCSCSAVQSFPTLCEPMGCCTPGLTVPHCILELAQVHVHCIGDAIQPSHHLSPSSPSVLNLSQHQGLFQWVGCCVSCPKSASVSTSVFPMNIQGWFPLTLTGLISLLSKGLSGVFSSTTVQKHQFFGILPSLWSSSYNHMWPLGRS